MSLRPAAKPVNMKDYKPMLRKMIMENKMDARSQPVDSRA